MKNKVEKIINKPIIESLLDVLKPKSKDEIIQSALKIKDPNKLLDIAINIIKDPNIVKMAMERGADPNKIWGSDKFKDPNILKIILTNSKTNIAINSMIYNSIKLGLDKEIIDLIKNKKLDPSAKNAQILIWAVGFGKKNLIKEILKNKNINPKTNEENIIEALCIAIARKDNNVLKILLNDNRIDLDASNERIITLAKEFNNKEALNLLKISNKKKNMEKNKIVKESLVEDVGVAEPTTKPTVKPGIKPVTKPGAPNPIRRIRPSVTPGPKATAEDVTKKFLDLIK